VRKHVSKWEGTTHGRTIQGRLIWASSDFMSTSSYALASEMESLICLEYFVKFL
jgi:hypothetical protein